MTALSLIVTHLNAPYGPVVDAEDLRASLVGGQLHAHTEKAEAVLAGLFLEVEPRLIARGAQEAMATFEQANQLYLDTIHKGSARCPAWESAIENLL